MNETMGGAAVSDDGIGRAPGTSLDSIAEDVRRWQRETFPPSPTDVAFYRGKVAEEAWELCETELGSAEERIELADVVICCIGCADRAGFDLAAAIAEKLEINRKRTWKERR